MTSHQGDQYPIGPGAESFPSLLELDDLARDEASALAAQYPLNYDAVEMHMRALAGLYNGPLMDEGVYRHLPPIARAASRNTADTAWKYFEHLGLKSEVMRELGSLRGRYSDRDYDDQLINHMQMHVSIAARHEQSRRQTERYRRMARPAVEGDESELWQELEEAETAVHERRTGDFPYDEAGIREVLQVFGRNFGYVAEGLVAVTLADPQKLLGHAYSSLRAAQPRLS